MTLKAVNIASTFKNLAESDRVAQVTAFGNRAGVIFTYAATQGACTDLQVTPTAAAHSVTIGAGRAIILEKTAPATRGGYFFIADAPEVVTLPAPQGQPFIATVIARVTDPQYGTVAGAVGPRIDIVSGTASASPVAVADATIDGVTQTPGGWIRLADVRINTADTVAVPGGQFTDRRVPGGVGAITKGWSTTAMPASVRGDLFFDYATSSLKEYNGSIWAKPNAKLFTGSETFAIPASVPPAGTEYIEQTFTRTANTESAGGGLPIPFPVAFPNAFMGMICSIVNGGTQWTSYIPGYSNTQAYVTVQNAAGASVGAGASVTVAVYAWGW